MPEIPVNALLALPLAEIVPLLGRFLGSYVTELEGTRGRVEQQVDAVMASAPEAECAELLEHMLHLGEDFGVYRRNPLAMRITQAFMEPLTTAESTIEGLDQVVAGRAMAQGRRLMIVGNHLSYVDTSALCHLLAGAGHQELREAVTAVAGPKVYIEPMRRLAAAGINSIKVAQSTSVATGEAAMSPRDVVRIARRSLTLAGELMDDGLVVLLYPEGRRSRSGRLQSFIRATNRWLSLPGVVLLPTAIWGTEKLYSIDEDLMHPAECHARFGRPIDVDELLAGGADRDGVLSATWDAVVELLPPRYAPDEGTPKST